MFHCAQAQLRKPVCAGASAVAAVAIFVNRGSAVSSYGIRRKTAAGGQRFWMGTDTHGREPSGAVILSLPHSQVCSRISNVGSS